VPREPLDEAKDHARDADRALDQASEKAAFAGPVERVTDRQVGLAQLEGELGRARSRGWVWDREWEETAADLKKRASEVVRTVQTESRSASSRMRSDIDQCRRKLTRTSVTAGNRDELERIEEEADSVKDAVEAEEKRISALAAPFCEPYDKLKAAVSKAHVHLERFEQAKFQLGAGEHPWLTAEATWQDAPGGAVSGFLYLTDKRLRFEQKETVATKKFLFFTTESQEKHACLLDEPVGNIARSDDSTKGLLFKDQLVTLGWQNTKWKKTTFDINSGDSAKEWDTYVEELRSGRFAHRMVAERAVAPNAGMPVNAPTVCGACSAALDAPVRGMTVLVCKYCGQRHDLQFA
jgi:hypothetical protein